MSRFPVLHRRRQQPLKAASNPFDLFSRSFDDLFSDYLSNDLMSNRFIDATQTHPALARLNISETDTAIEVSVDLPGMDQENIDVSLADGVLTIQGEREDETKDDKKDYHRVERSYGVFCRQIAMPSTIDEDQVDAKFENGVLVVTCKKSAQAKEQKRKISVKAA